MALPKLLSTKQVAEWRQCSQAAIRNMVARRQIPFRKMHGRLVFCEEELIEWLESFEGLSLKDIKAKEY